MSYKRRDFIRHLEQHGCVLKREGSSHSWWTNLRDGRSTSVPRHTSIDRHLAKKICKDLGIAPM